MPSFSKLEDAICKNKQKNGRSIMTQKQDVPRSKTTTYNKLEQITYQDENNTTLSQLHAMPSKNQILYSGCYCRIARVGNCQELTFAGGAALKRAGDRRSRN